MAGRTVYQPKDWNNGETITEAALDHIEQGIFNADNEVVTARGTYNDLSSALSAQDIRISQNFTDSQKSIARTNINAVKMSISGNTLILNG